MNNNDFNVQGQFNYFSKTRNVGNGQMPNVMAALPNIGGALCSTPQSLADASTRVPCSNAAKTHNPLKNAWGPKLPNRSQPLVDRSSPYAEDMWGRHCCLTSFFSRSSICVVIVKI